MHVEMDMGVKPNQNLLIFTSIFKYKSDGNSIFTRIKNPKQSYEITQQDS